MAAGSIGDFKSIVTPPRRFSPFSSLLSGRRCPALAARLGLCLARFRRRPLKLGKTIVAARHVDVAEILRRDLDFIIAPINAARIQAVNGPFVLGMDRSPGLTRERQALYGALAAVDMDELAGRLRTRAAASIGTLGATFDTIRDFARPLAAGTASDLFGIAPDDKPLFAEVARAIFAHTFLNLGGDRAIEARALKAAPHMKLWFEAEIAWRRTSGELGRDFMGHLLRQAQLDDEGVRRTLGGMLVGSIDTTVSAVARILCVVWSDKALETAIKARWQAGHDIYGYCLEALRRWPHNPILLRQAAADTKLAGMEIGAGHKIIAWTQAAMLDPEAFADPHRMLPDRPAAGYLHFGAGLHPCAGRAVNDFQIPILVGTLLAKGARRAGGLKWAGPFPDRLPVRLAGDRH